jgi:hypothetical protein
MDHTASATVTQTEKTLSSRGLHLPDRPMDGHVAVPKDLTQLKEGELVELMNEVRAWSGYAAAELARAAVAERESEQYLEHVRARAAVRNRSEKSVAAQKAAAAADPDVQRATGDLNEAYAYRRLCEPITADYAATAALLSRELTRRTSVSTWDRNAQV